MAERGSDRLFQRCEPFSRDTLTKLGDLVEAHGARLVGWECLGTPHPDVLQAVAHVDDLDRTLELVRQIIDLEPRLGIGVFPRGIPPFERFLELRFGSQLARG